MARETELERQVRSRIADVLDPEMGTTPEIATIDIIEIVRGYPTAVTPPEQADMARALNAAIIDAIDFSIKDGKGFVLIERTSDVHDEVAFDVSAINPAFVTVHVPPTTAPEILDERP